MNYLTDQHCRNLVFVRSSLCDRKRFFFALRFSY